jgi:uncharacterized protein DUF4087
VSLRRSSPRRGEQDKGIDRRVGRQKMNVAKLISLDAEWTIGAQGGYQVERDWDWPAFKEGQWVETNGHYGYGCACMQVRVDRRTKKVLEIKSTRARPLAACRRDPSLKKRKRYLDP